MARYSIARLARSDIDGIWDRIARDNPAAADRVVDSLHERFLLLGRHPLLGELRPEIRSGLRSFVVGSYVIYCEVVRDRVRIARVLHGSRDLKGLF
jgi:toxin ParE1/3/4